MGNKRDYKKDYEEFWKPLIEDENGNVIKDNLMRELSDFSLLMHQASRVYEEAAGLSKPFTHASAVIDRMHDTYVRKDFLLDDLLEVEQNGKVSVEDIRRLLQDGSVH